jgi:hypothetical protein
MSAAAAPSAAVEPPAVPAARPSIAASAAPRERAPSWLTLPAKICGPILLAWALVYLTWPMAYDTAILAWVGDIVRHGGVPYRDALEIRGPAPFYVYAGLQALFGMTEWALRAFDLALFLAGGWALSRIAERDVPGAARWVGAFLLLLWYSTHDAHNSAQSDGWNGILLAFVVLLALRGDARPRYGRAVAAGVLVSLCVMSKPTYLLFVGMAPAYWLLRALFRRQAMSAAVLESAAHVAAVVLPVALQLAYYSSIGAFDEFVDVHFKFTVSQYAHLDSAWLNRAQYLAKYFSTGPYAIASVLAVVGLVAVWQRRREDAVLLALWLSGTIVTVTAQGKFWSYHWLTMYPALALLTGIGAARAAQLLSAQATVLSRALLAALAALLLLSPTVDALMHVYRIALGMRSPAALESAERIEFGSFGKRTGLMHRVSEAAAAASAPGETVLAWGKGSPVNYFAQRPSVGRYSNTDIFFYGQDNEFRRRYRADFVSEFRQRPPAVVLVRSERLCAAGDRRQPAPATAAESDAVFVFRCRSELAEVGVPSLAGYAPVQEVSGVDVLRRQDAPARR